MTIARPSLRRQNRDHLRVAVVFQNGFDDWIYARKTLENWHKERRIRLLMWLDRGPKDLGSKLQEWAFSHGIPVIIFPDKKIDSKIGRWTTDDRIQKMMDIGSPQKVMLFGQVDPITRKAGNRGKERNAFVTRY